MSPKYYQNERKSYQCEDCKVWFRLEMVHRTHKCIKKHYNKNRRRNF